MEKKNQNGQNGVATSAEIEFTKRTITDDAIVEKFKEIVGVDSYVDNKTYSTIEMDIYDGDMIRFYSDGLWDIQLSNFNVEQLMEDYDAFDEFAQWWENLDD